MTISSSIHWQKKHLFLVIVLLLTQGCVLKDMGNTTLGSMADFGHSVEYEVKGDYYLGNKDYKAGTESFANKVKADPENPRSNYYYGRFLLANDKSRKALPYLKKAARLKGNNPDYYFWQGVAQGMLGLSKEEKRSYKKALSLDKKHLQSLIYIGHNQLGAKQYKTALLSYSRALKIWPGCPSALYNQALIMGKLGRTPEEKLAWLEYLSLYPSGGMARRAVIHLNRLKDFSYRNYRLGARTVTLEKIYFEPFTAKIHNGSVPSLQLLGSIFNNMQGSTLQIVMYQKNNKELARRRGISIKKYLLKKFPKINPKRIKLSWFAVPEKLVQNKKRLLVEESVSFFVTQQ